MVMSVEIQIDLEDSVLSGRRSDPDSATGLADGPLLVALHGGSYSSKYFDSPGYSLLDRAAAAGCSAVALDRPGYTASTLLKGDDEILPANAIPTDFSIVLERMVSFADPLIVQGGALGDCR